MQLAMWLVKLYPARWRNRYEAEMLVLLEQHHITARTLVDLLFGMITARLDPQYRSESGLVPLVGPRKATWVFLTAVGIFVLLAQYVISTISQGMWLVLTGKTMETQPDFFVPAGVPFYSWMSTGSGASIWHKSPFLTLLFLAVTGLVLGTSLWWAVRRRHWGFLALAAICFALPGAVEVWLLQQSPDVQSAVSGSYGSTAPLGLLTILGELEALTGVIFLSIVKGKQAIAARRYGLMGLVLGVNLFLVLIVVYLFNTQGTFTLIGGPVARQIEQDTELLGLAAFLLPFATVGMVLLSVGGSEISKRLWQFMLGGASLFCLLMVVFLVFFSVAALYAWQHNQQLRVWYPVPEWMPWYPAAYVPVQVVWAGLLLSTALALGALCSMVGAFVTSSRARLATS